MQTRPLQCPRDLCFDTFRWISHVKLDISTLFVYVSAFSKAFLRTGVLHTHVQILHASCSDSGLELRAAILYYNTIESSVRATFLVSIPNTTYINLKNSDVESLTLNTLYEPYMQGFRLGKGTMFLLTIKDGCLLHFILPDHFDWC